VSARIDLCKASLANLLVDDELADGNIIRLRRPPRGRGSVSHGFLQELAGTGSWLDGGEPGGLSYSKDVDV